MSNFPKMLYRKAANGDLETRTFADADELAAAGKEWGSRRAALGLPESEQPIVVKEGDVRALKDELAAAKTVIEERDVEIKALKDELAAAKPNSKSGAGKGEPKA